jgi:hypothetical protein
MTICKHRAHVQTLTIMFTVEAVKTMLIKLSSAQLAKHYAMKTWGNWRYSSALDEGEWSASRPCRFTSLGGKSPRYPLERKLDGPGVGLDAVDKRTILYYPETESGPSSS